MKLLKRLVITVLLIIIAFVGLAVNEGYKMYQTEILNKTIEEKVNEIKSMENYASYEDLPKDYINAVVAVEDKRFFTHNGLDVISIIRAIIVDITTFSLKEGGSTITQQLAKNIYFTQEKKLARKVAEMLMAKRLEEVLSKEEIFALYVNTSYFGDGYYCVKDASLGYFDKLPKNMNLYESTLLAGIPNAPSVYAPTKNPDLARQRQKKVIKKMLEQGYITEEEAAKIISDNE